MADDRNFRPHRSSETIARTGQGRGAASSGGDPLAELARLIGQNDPFGDAMHASARFAESAGVPPAVDWTAPSTQPASEQPFIPGEFSFPRVEATRSLQPAAAQAYVQPPVEPPTYQREQDVPAYLTARATVAPPERDSYEPSAEPFHPEQQDFYDEAVPSRRRLAVLAVAAIFGLAVVGTAGAFGYRSLFGGSGSRVPPIIQADKSPLKVVPDSSSADKKAIADRVTDSSEKLLPREEKPVDVSQKLASAAAADAPATQPRALGSGVVASEPKKVHTIVIRPDGADAQQAMASPMPPASAATPVAATPPAPASPPPATVASAPPARPPVAEPKSVRQAPQRAAADAPLSLSPNAESTPHTPVRMANAGSTSTPAPMVSSAKTGGYAVQVSSQRSEAEAKAAFHSLQGKYPTQLGSRSMFVHKVALGAKGTYYRAMVGPFASASEANEVCSGLKSAGGSCLVQKN